MAVTPTLHTKIIALSIIVINIGTTIYHFLRGSNNKSLELRIYTDNIVALLLIAMFPLQLFYGASIQILFSVIVTHLYLKKRAVIYDVLLFLSVTEIIIYFPLSSFKIYPQLIYNATSMLLLITVILIIKKKLVLSPEARYKKILLDTNSLIRHEIIQCITPMSYYVRGLDDDSKEIMERLINRLHCLAKNHNSNFGYLISLIKTTLSFSYKQKVNINLVDQTNKELEIDSYTLLLALYVVFESSISNQATDIIVKFDNKKIEIIDNGTGFDIKSKTFTDSKLQTALELLQLHDIPLVVSSVVGSGTIITLLIE